MRAYLSLGALTLLLAVTGCGSGANPGRPDGSTLLPDAGQDGGTRDAGTDAGSDAGTPDAGQPDAGIDTTDPNNVNKDSDCDGLSDAEELSTTYAGGLKTDPLNPDTDGDGIPDGVEVGRTSSVDSSCGFTGDADPATFTSPVNADTDGDGISDGLEDANHDGKVEAGETDPLDPDSDGDGIPDGVEDANHDGVRQATETDPRLRDTDGDGISDGVEDKNHNGQVDPGETDPKVADTDGDGCVDGFEDGNQDGIVETGETDPLNGGDCGVTQQTDTDGDGIPDSVETATGTDPNKVDTDGDGLPDGLEDKNHNGKVDVGETDPRRIDTDCDGLIDGPDQPANGLKGEDQNANGSVDTGETNPTMADTDGDGLSDGLELGVATEPDATNCPNYVGDADPSTTTNPTNPDSDGDGISDGAEDSNQNGQTDPGELDPNNASDGSGPAGAACASQNLQPVVFHSEGNVDLQIAVPATFTEIATASVGGSAQGVLGYDGTNHVAFLLYRTAAPASSTTPTGDESALRTTIAGQGALSNVLTKTFTTWDGYAALQAFYDQAGSGDLKTQANALANALIGSGAGVLSGTAGVSGPFKLEAEYVHRSDKSVVVLIALIPSASYTGTPVFTVSDTAGGSSLAQFADGDAVQCEVFYPGPSKVDFVFVIDDSLSMDSYQQALADTASEVAAKLNNSSLDWRIALVTTDYHNAKTNKSGNHYANYDVMRGFTTDITQFESWLTTNSSCSNGVCSLPATNPTCDPAGGSNGGCWVDTTGSGAEGTLGAARKAVDHITQNIGADATQLRSGAQLVVVLLGDADDQTVTYTSTSTDCGTACEPASDFVSFFTGDPNGSNASGTRNLLDKNITVNGIICPTANDDPNTPNHSCGEYNPNPQRHAAVITATGGVRGDITTSASIQATIDQIIDNTINAAGHKTQKPPIGASVKVVMDGVTDAANCTTASNGLYVLPRSRQNGFDVDGLTGSISLFGGCRPLNPGTTQAAVSYRYWIDNSTNPDGSPPPCSSDPYYDPSDPDFCKGHLVCDRASNACECPSDCGGGTPPANEVCDTNVAVCDFVCTPDCGGACTGYQTCDTGTCGCVCETNASCPAGYAFVNNGSQCGCHCDTAALACGSNYQADPDSCSCVCKSDCGGCPTGSTCDPNSCTCSVVFN